MDGELPRIQRGSPCQIEVMQDHEGNLLANGLAPLSESKKTVQLAQEPVCLFIVTDQFASV